MRAPSVMPRIANSSVRSFSSRAAAASAASCSASVISLSAAAYAEEIERMFIMRSGRVSRRCRDAGSWARRVATSASPCASVAAWRASASSTPSAASLAATSAIAGTGSCTGRQRERIVTSTSVGEGAVSSQIVCGGGSSIAFKSTLEVRSGMRSVSSIRITRHRPTDGLSCAFITSSRASSMLMLTASVRKCVKSECEPFSTVTQPLQVPHPRSAGSGCSHSSAAAKIRAARRCGAPAAPVKSQACVGRSADASWRSWSSVPAGRISSSHRLIGRPLRYHRR